MPKSTGKPAAWPATTALTECLWGSRVLQWFISGDRRM